jgi:hypothetical protein
MTPTYRIERAVWREETDDIAGFEASCVPEPVGQLQSQLATLTIAELAACRCIDNQGLVVRDASVRVAQQARPAVELRDVLDLSGSIRALVDVHCAQLLQVRQE